MSEIANVATSSALLILRIEAVVGLLILCVAGVIGVVVLVRCHTASGFYGLGAPALVLSRVVHQMLGLARLDWEMSQTPASHPDEATISRCERWFRWRPRLW